MERTKTYMGSDDENNADDDDIDDVKNEIARSSYAGMLHDDERHRKYFDALRETMLELRRDGCKEITTLDIGTGTGILSMMAAEAGSDHVVACEMFEPVSQLASEITRANKLSSRISVVNKASNELIIPHDLPRKVDVLVTEIFDSELFGEGVLPTLHDAHKRLTHSNVRTIPSAAAVNLQLIQSFPLWSMNKLREFKDVGIRFPSVFMKCPGTASAHELQISHIAKQSYGKVQLLSKPFCITTIDFTKSFKHSMQENNNLSYSMAETMVTVSSGGTLHGVVLWWDLILHQDKNIVLSMQPSWLTEQDFGNDTNYTWRDHWMQCVYYLRNPMLVAKGDQIKVRMYFDDYSVWFDFAFVGGENDCAHRLLSRPLCQCGLHVSWPRERFALWNDYAFVKMWQSILDTGTNKRNMVVLGETSILPLVIGQNNSVDLTYVERSGWTSKRIIKELCDFNNLGVRHVSFEEFKREASDEYDAIVVDPIWSSSILPWHHLRTWSLLHELRQERSFKFPSKVYPRFAYLKVCIVSFSHLWKVEAPVVEISGFDLKLFDSFMDDARGGTRVGNHGFFYSAAPYTMMEYENEVVSDVKTLATFDFNSPLLRDICTFTKELRCSRTIDKTSALVSWVDFQLSGDEIDDDKFHTITTGLTDDKTWAIHSRQAVVFVPKYIQDKQHNVLKCQALYESENHEVVFRFL